MFQLKNKSNAAQRLGSYDIPALGTIIVPALPVGTDGAINEGILVVTEVAAGAIDSSGTAFNPDACSHAYTYDTSGNILTDTATETATGVVRRKTFTWTDGLLMTETAWVKQ